MGVGQVAEARIQRPGPARGTVAVLGVESLLSLHRVKESLIATTACSEALSLRKQPKWRAFHVRLLSPDGGCAVGCTGLAPQQKQ